MKTRFIGLLNRIGALGNSKEEFDILAIMYSEPKRFYHNMKHIENCLIELDSIKNLGKQHDLVELAIWYHDAVYTSQTKDNEERSAQMAYDVCTSAQLPEEFGIRVRDLILETKHDAVPKEFDAKTLVDIDLSILGKTPSEFDEYEQNIRREYSWVSEDQFRKGRSLILQTFLNRDSIYSTDFFKDKYEIQARINLQNSLVNST